jgi:hypothetical protein
MPQVRNLRLRGNGDHFNFMLGRYRRQVNHRRKRARVECLEAEDGSYQGYVAAVAERLLSALFTLMERVVEGVTDVVDDDNYTVSVRVARTRTTQRIVIWPCRARLPSSLAGLNCCLVLQS